MNRTDMDLMVFGSFAVFDSRLVASFVNCLKSISLSNFVPFCYQILPITLNELNPNAQLHQTLVLLDRNVVTVSSRTSRLLF